jgi:prophage regulatory protein
MTAQIVSVKVATQLLGISRSSLYERINPHSPRYEKSFPPLISLGDSSRRVGFILESLEVWIRSRPAARGTKR